MDRLLQDLQFGFRQLRKSPGFTLIAVATLAIGIGANTAGFSVMDAVVLRPLAVPGLDQVVTVQEQQNHGSLQWVALANFEDWQRQSRTFEEMAARETVDLSLTGAGDAAHVQGELITPKFFSVLRAHAFLGRLFDLDETRPGRDSVAVLTWPFWKSHFDSDPGVVGRKVELNRRSYTIVGVMPKSMQYPSTADFFLPFAPTEAQLANRGSHDYQVIGRLRPGISPGQAQAELNLIANHLAQAYPATNQGWSVRIEPLLATLNGDYTPLYMNLIAGATLFVLLVVCANIANLQFARGIVRRPEIAMRTALGAGRARLMRQLLTENILLGLIGGIGGLIFASFYLRVFLYFMPERVARFMSGWSNISLNGRVLVYSLLLAILAGIVSGFAPALGAVRVRLVDQLKAGSRSVAGAAHGHRLRNLLAAAQISLAVALVVGAALMCKGMLGMLHVADRYHPARVLTFNVHLPAERYNTPEKQAAWFSQSLDRIRALPGVRYAEITTALPYTDYGWVDNSHIENRPVASGQSRPALRLPVSPGFFSAFHIPLVAGRLFNSSDDLRSRPVALVSQSYADRYFHGENPIGRRIRMETGTPAQTPWMTIVGVVGETNYNLWLRDRPAAVYMDTAQQPQLGATYAIGVQGDPLSLGAAIRRVLAGIDPGLPLDAMQSYAHFMHENLTGMFYTAGMLGFDALVALLLAAIGIFGVMANLVGERSREIGLRLAMGARRQDVLAMILRRAAWLTVAGVCAGLALASALAHAVANLLYQVSPSDPGVFAGITAAIAGVAMAASWLPARRAARIEPMTALRDE